jgi:hypothetical protein
MMLLTGLSVALALSVMTSNNFYAEKVTNASINDFNRQAETSMSDVITKGINNAISNKNGKCQMTFNGLKC